MRSLLLPLLAGLTGATAVWSLFPARARPPREATPSPAAESGRVASWRPLWVALAAAGAWAVVGGAPGVVAGLVVAVVVARLAGADDPRRRREEQEARRDLPAAVLLLAVTLRSGSAVEPALRQVSAALPGAATDRLGPVAERLALGVEPARVWAELGVDPALGPLGRTLARVQRSGAPVAGAVERLADELAEAARSGVEDRARAVGVRAAVPLAVCLLPSFLLLGIVPLVAGMLSGLQL